MQCQSLRQATVLRPLSGYVCQRWHRNLPFLRPFSRKPRSRLGDDRNWSHTDHRNAPKLYVLAIQGTRDADSRDKTTMQSAAWCPRPFTRAHTVRSCRYAAEQVFPTYPSMQILHKDPAWQRGQSVDQNRIHNRLERNQWNQKQITKKTMIGKKQNKI